MEIRFDHTTLGQRVLFGAGEAGANIAAALRDLGTSRPLLVGGGHAAGVVDQVSEEFIVAGHIREVVQHVPAERAREAVALAQQVGADLVVAIGGGSATGLAKIVARDTGLPVVAVPTTFSGSEATDIWGMTEDERKTTGTDLRVLPRVVVYDATLTLGLPPDLAVHSGLNALAHAVDSLWASRADPINRAMAGEGMRALVPGLRGLRADPADVRAHEQVLYGTYLSGVALASAGAGMHHKICHVLGGTFNLPHAPTHAVVLPYVAAFNAEADPDSDARIAETLGTPQGAAGLWDLAREVGAPGSLGGIGFTEDDVELAAELATAAIPDSNPAPVSQERITTLLRSALWGDHVCG
ncbi:maleylacetate reductase [Serinicoccus chungangensis]|uniref:Maleylacetate reductase n=1 Tax=Serinicoccus chungangensis TaxID=767452 RepID=A0A0W8I559_9MICO|nr:maleylacetate reductase [Serinicoccus chungangensis]KUG53397.1 maleylacetate reductase [Serinicoccus chungangensis]